MTNSSVERSRIRDGVRDSKIRLDTPSMFKQRSGSFLPESHHDVAWLRHNRTHDDHRVRRDFARVSADEVSRRFQRCNLREVNNHVDFTTRFVDNEWCLYNYQEMEDPFYGFCDSYGGADSLVDKFKRNLPYFDGFWQAEDLMTWIEAIEDFFEELNPPEHVKCKIVANKMKGRAYYWWKQLQNERIEQGKEEIKSWSRMKELLIIRFVPSNCSTKCSTEFYKNSQGKKHVCSLSDGLYHNAAVSQIVETTPAENTLKQITKIGNTGDSNKNDCPAGVFVNEQSKEMVTVKPANCSTICPLQSVKAKQEEKDADGSSKEDESSKRRAERFMPSRCLTEVPYESYINKQEVHDLWAVVEPRIICENSGIETLVKSGSSKPNIDGIIGHVGLRTTSLGDMSVLVKGIITKGQEVEIKHDTVVDSKEAQVGKTTEETDKAVEQGTNKKGNFHPPNAIDIPMVWNDGSQATNASFALKDVLKLGAYDVDFLTKEMLICNFDPGGKLSNKPNGYHCYQNDRLHNFTKYVNLYTSFEVSALLWVGLGGFTAFILFGEAIDVPVKCVFHELIVAVEGHFKLVSHMLKSAGPIGVVNYVSIGYDFHSVSSWHHCFKWGINRFTLLSFLFYLLPNMLSIVSQAFALKPYYKKPWKVSLTERSETDFIIVMPSKNMAIRLVTTSASLIVHLIGFIHNSHETNPVAMAHMVSIVTTILSLTRELVGVAKNEGTLSVCTNVIWLAMHGKQLWVELLLFDSNAAGRNSWISSINLDSSTNLVLLTCGEYMCSVYSVSGFISFCFDPGGVKKNDLVRAPWQALHVNKEACKIGIVFGLELLNGESLSLIFDPGGKCKIEPIMNERQEQLVVSREEQPFWASFEGFVSGGGISSLMYARNEASSSEPPCHYRDRRDTGNSEMPSRKKPMMSHSLFLLIYWYWIGVDAPLGSTVLFNIPLTFHVYLQQRGLGLSFHLLSLVFNDFQVNLYLFTNLCTTIPLIYQQEDSDPIFAKVLFFCEPSDYTFRITRGRVISLEGWKDDDSNAIGEFIIAKPRAVTILSCLTILFKNENSKTTLRLFYKVVNGLDPPMDLNDKLVRSQRGFLRVRSWTSS